MGLTPALFTSAKPDGTDPTKLQPSFWNRVTALLNSLLNGAETHGSVMYRDTADATDGASYAASAAGVLACAGAGQAPTFRALATTDLPTGAAFSLFTSTATASNVSTGETDLITYAMPANTLAVNNQKVRITVFGSFAATGNNKTIKVYFGSTAVLPYGPVTSSNQGWRFVVDVIRTGASAEIVSSIGGNAGSGQNILTTALAESLTAPVTIKVTGQSATASGDVTARGLFVDWLG